ncbi:MAG TPA: sterol desaturase family protein [Allosphingosinicella sp.]|nr:sterol desaturase family protein [Allosphingosinicella sp.]
MTDGGPALLGIFAASFIVLAILEVLAARSLEPQQRRRRWRTNGALTLLFILVNGLMPVTLVAAAGLASQRDFGVLNLLGLAPAAAFVLTILARSLIAYATHRTMHIAPWLWRIHRVHHLDPRLDVSTAARFHPVEPAIVNGIALVFVLLLGLDPLAVLSYELAEAAMAVFSHANVRLPPWLDRGLGWLLVTPDLHRVHHSPLQSETDSNFGSTLSIWDRLFGTWRRKPADALAAQRVGLDECADERAASLLWLLASPVMGTGWRRRDSAAREAE